MRRCNVEVCSCNNDDTNRDSKGPKRYKTKDSIYPFNLVYSMTKSYKSRFAVSYIKHVTIHEHHSRINLQYCITVDSLLTTNTSYNRTRNHQIPAAVSVFVRSLLLPTNSSQPLSYFATDTNRGKVLPFITQRQANSTNIRSLLVISATLTCIVATQY